MKIPSYEVQKCPFCGQGVIAGQVLQQYEDEDLDYATYDYDNGKFYCNRCKKVFYIYESEEDR